MYVYACASACMKSVYVRAHACVLLHIFIFIYTHIYIYILFTYNFLLNLLREKARIEIVSPGTSNYLRNLHLHRSCSIIWSIMPLEIISRTSHTVEKHSLNTVFLVYVLKYLHFIYISLAICRFSLSSQVTESNKNVLCPLIGMQIFWCTTVVPQHRTRTCAWSLLHKLHKEIVFKLLHHSSAR